MKFTNYTNTAINLISDREKPDYRNSIKESMSEVESFCTKITKSKKDALVQALNYIKENPNNI